jgi:hypothetical protein
VFVVKAFLQTSWNPANSLGGPDVHPRVAVSHTTTDHVSEHRNLFPDENGRRTFEFINTGRGYALVGRRTEMEPGRERAIGSLVRLYQLFALVLNDLFATFVTRLTRTSAAAKRKAAG